MSEVVTKPMKRVLISRKLAFVVGIVAAISLIGVMAWSEKRHDDVKADKVQEEREKAAKELAESPPSDSLEAVLQTQKTEAERTKVASDSKPADESTVRLEGELNRELNRQPTATAGPTQEELKKAKEEELAMSAYGSEMVALKKGGAIGAMANGIDSLIAGGAPRAQEGLIPSQDMNLLRDAQRPAAASTSQDRNRSFLSNVGGRQGEAYVEPGRAERVLHEGSVIPSVVARGINSDLPGQVELRTTRDVYDSVNAKVLVIPRGTRAIGSYSSDISAGQDRVLVAFHRLIFPDGRNLYLGNAQGADREGASGFHDRVNTHFLKMVGSSLLLAAIARGVEGDATTVNIGGTSGSTSNSPGQIMVNTSESALGRYTNIPPTIQIRPGTQVNILVNKDIVL